MYTKTRQKSIFWLKILETSHFQGIFGKISKEMLILIHIPSYKHMFYH